MQELARMMYEFIQENNHLDTFLDQLERKGYDVEEVKNDLEEHLED
jgi:hypothetical protein